MFLVTGATGDLGRRILAELLTLVPPDQIIACTRDPARATDLAARGVSVRQADYGDPASLARGFAGAKRLLLISSNAASRGGNPLADHRRALQAAQTAGVAHILYTSHMASAAASRFAPARDHAATEMMLAASGLAWTALRHGFYASSGIGLTRQGLLAGLIEAPQDGPVSWTSHDDLARADALLLAGQGPRIDGPTPPLTGGETLDFADIAAVATEVLGRKVDHRRLTDHEYEASAAARGMPDRAIDFMMSYFHAARAKEFAVIDPTLQQLLGRNLQTLQTVLTKSGFAP